MRPCIFNFDFDMCVCVRVCPSLSFFTCIHYTVNNNNIIYGARSRKSPECLHGYKNTLISSLTHAHTHTHARTHAHTHTHTSKKTKLVYRHKTSCTEESLQCQDDVSVTSIRRDVSNAKIFWGSSRHHGCEIEVVPAAPSLLLLLAPGQSSLFSAGEVCRPTSLAKLRSTLDTGHARRQQFNCSLTWRKRPSSGKKPPRDRCVGVSVVAEVLSGKDRINCCH